MEVGQSLICAIVETTETWGQECPFELLTGSADPSASSFDLSFLTLLVYCAFLGTASHFLQLFIFFLCITWRSCARSAVGCSLGHVSILIERYVIK